MASDIAPIVVVDSSALVSLISETDANHELAQAMSRRLKDLQAAVLTPADVFSETINVLGKRFGHAIALEAAKLILDSDLFVIEETNDELRRAALELFENQAASVSLTDCVVMALADQFETSDIFGFDGVFKTNGYHIPAATDLEDAA